MRCGYSKLCQLRGGWGPCIRSRGKRWIPPAQGRRLAAKERLLRRLHESLYVLFGITAHAASKWIDGRCLLYCCNQPIKGMNNAAWPLEMFSNDYTNCWLWYLMNSRSERLKSLEPRLKGLWIEGGQFTFSLEFWTRSIHTQAHHSKSMHQMAISFKYFHQLGQCFLKILAMTSSSKSSLFEAFRK